MRTCNHKTHKIDNKFCIIQFAVNINTGPFHYNFLFYIHLTVTKRRKVCESNNTMSKKSEKLDDIKLLFQRPNEPLFTAKDNGKTVFDVPPEFYTERYKTIGVSIGSRLGEDAENTIPLRSIPKYPDLEFTRPIKIRGSFSLFNKTHQQIAGRLIEIFLEAPSQDLTSTAAYIKDRVNPYLFLYALSTAIQHRDDTQSISLPSIVEQFPDQFVDSSVFPRAREEGEVVPAESRMPIQIEMNFTASDREQEQRVAYFREDIGVNMHHWHWHLVYPGEGPLSVVQKDRRGELFYYMHNQIVARYNNERICNGLERVKPLSNLRERIPEGYFPKIVRSLNNRSYPGRPVDMLLQDTNRDDELVEIVDLERWRDRIHQAIDQGYVIEANTNRQIPLDEINGIDILGNLIESSALSPNRKLYGELHNAGHNLISYVHDPDNRHLEDYGVMADVTTAMRDPIFYRWHSFLDTIFVKFKNNLQPYQSSDLAFNGIDVNSVSVRISTGTVNVIPNVLATFWQKSDVDLGAGLDFGPGNVYAQFTHLQHAPFVYEIDIINGTSTIKQGTCRIFLIPKVDERGQPLRFREQRQFAIEMDKFLVNLNPGPNQIRRRSDESSVTIPYERSFRRIGSQYQPKNPEDLEQFQFCGCGWPQHMLLPKGSQTGTKYDLFVIVSDYERDRVDPISNMNTACSDAYSFCGLRNQKYPDRRAMGYPLDRNTQLASNQIVNNVSEFAQNLSNANVAECTIRFSNSIISRT